ncbi:uncharacterized protein [Montipora capricornis]|uniref:uncharacterized protein n=1 Tax=Montipora capricornis TaxID=246305 RepID=UPI0035F16664
MSKRAARITGSLTLEELNQATHVIVCSVQNECSLEDVKALKKDKEVKKSSKLANLRPVLLNGTLRVGGRLQEAVALSWDETRAMILPKGHHVSQLLVRHYHETAAHSGREQTLSELRRMFWIIAGRTNRELKESFAQWNEERIERQLQQKGIKCVLQPPASPHMSGVWERLVQTTKKHLKSVVGDGLRNDLELRTLLVESIVNNRPITAVSDDPADFAALTPNHLMLQRATQVPPGVFMREDKFSRRGWRKVQFFVDH